MADLRALVEACGFRAPRTYIQSGNVVFEAAAAAKVEAKLEAALLAKFGFAVPVVARTAAQWGALAAENPFAAECVAEANHVHALLSKAPALPAAAEGLAAKALGGERVVATASALWAHFPAGLASTKLTPALMDRLVGSKVTARNWRTVAELGRMASA